MSCYLFKLLSGCYAHSHLKNSSNSSRFPRSSRVESEVVNKLSKSSDLNGCDSAERKNSNSSLVTSHKGFGFGCICNSRVVRWLITSRVNRIVSIAHVSQQPLMIDAISYCHLFSFSFACCFLLRQPVRAYHSSSRQIVALIPSFSDRRSR